MSAEITEIDWTNGDDLWLARAGNYWTTLNPKCVRELLEILRRREAERAGVTPSRAPGARWICGCPAVPPYSFTDHRAVCPHRHAFAQDLEGRNVRVPTIGAHEELIARVADLERRLESFRAAVKGFARYWRDCGGRSLEDAAKRVIEA